jgi:raffinose/stachyose/melibiose transport system substrate-binding protein
MGKIVNLKQSTRLGIVTAAGAAVFSLLPSVAAADTIVKWLHPEAQPKVVAVWRGIADAFEKSHPGVKIEMQFLENQAFKAKLPTLLQSSDAPSMFYSWGGGVLRAQAQTGMLRDVSPALDANGAVWRASLNPSAIDGLSADGKVWAAPFKVSLVSFYYNKELFVKAGVDASTITSWQKFLDAVKSLKAAGITPIAGGGGDKWPLHFYWGYLAIREAGKDGFQKAKSGDGEGFVAPAFVEAGNKLAELGKIEPFQNGYLGATWNDALGAFGNGKAAIILGFENTPGTQAANAADAKGQPLSNVGRFPFPVVDGAPGLATDNIGGINGWAITKNAPPETEQFLQYLSSIDPQRILAKETRVLPAAKGAADAIEEPTVREAADAVAAETWHQNFLDQDLGPSVGAVVNDVSVEIVSGGVSPHDAAQQIQDAFSLEAH